MITHPDEISVSIVIPTLNRSALLGDTLAGLARLDFPMAAYEIIVVDDGSSDDTPGVVQRFASAVTQPHVEYVRRSHDGLNPARNAGRSKARGALIAYLDDDVEVPPSWLRSVVDGAAMFPDTECFAGRIALRFEGSPPRWCRKHPLGETELELGEVAKETSYAWGANMIIRASAFERVGPFDDSLNHCGDEIEWQHRLKDASGGIVYLPEACVTHRRTAADLRLRKMLKGRYRKGRAWPRLARAMDRRMSVWGGALHIVKGLSHAGRLCSGGLLQAAFGLGHTVGAMKLLLAREDSNLSWLPARWRRTDR